MRKVFLNSAALLSIFGSLLLSAPGFGADHSTLRCCDITKSEFFPILPWDALHGLRNEVSKRPENGLQSIADCNFNMAGFVRREDLNDCKKLGLGGLYFPYTREFNHHSWSKLSPAEIDAKIKQFVHDAGKNPALVGFFITDEPGVKDFPALAAAVAAVKKYAPGKLAYINLFPNYATIGAPDKSQLGTEDYAAYLERFINEVHPQAISYDNYMVEMSMDLTNTQKAASYFDNLLEVRRVAQKYNLPYLNIVTANQIRPYSTPPSPANLLFQAYTTLAAGYRGVTWYTYFERGYHYAPIDGQGKKTQTWFYLREVNRQIATLAPILSKLQSTGVYFSKPPYPKLPTLPGKLIENVVCDSPLMVGEFEDAQRNSYAMIVNLSLERSTKFTIATKPGQKIRLLSSADATISAEDQNGRWLAAGEGVLMKITK